MATYSSASSRHMLADISPAQIAVAIAGAALITILGAWTFEAAGYLPCELCLKQRWAYYAGIPFALLAAVVCAQGPRSLRGPLFALLALLFVANSAFGVFHAGVEWGFWQGPTDCTGPLTKADSINDFLKQLETVKVVRCDAVAIRILGLSLAGWNAIICAGLALLALLGLNKSRAR